MENPLSLRLIKEEQESSEKLLELLVSSTHSPKGRFSKENSYIMLKRKIETTKNGNTVKLVLPFPHFLWMIGTNPGISKEKAVLHEPQTEQENMNREHITYIIHSGFISGYQNRYGDNLKPPTNVYHRMTA